MRLKKSNLDLWICETEGISEHYFTREVLEKLQLERLKLLLEAKNMLGAQPLYPQRLDSLEALSTLPFTTAQMLSDMPGRYLMTSQSEISRVISGSTSGTTGPSKRVFYTDKDTAHTIGFFAAGIGEMVSPGEKVLISFPFSGSFGLGDLIERAVQLLGATGMRPCPEPAFEKQCLFLLENQPDCYIGAPVPLLSLARCWQLLFPGHRFPIKRALISGDACPRSVTQALEQLLHTRLFPHYGSRECGLGGAVTCPAHEGMHLRENHILAEIVDRSLQPVPDGVFGELVITTIGLSAMPLIRYRTGDRTRILPEHCPCGSILKRLDRVSRISDEPLTQESLDDQLFAVPELIDFRAESSKTALNITALVSDLACERKILEIARQCCQDRQPHIKVKLFRSEDGTFYPGKRYLISQD